jgi:hypothetical protein
MMSVCPKVSWSFPFGSDGSVRNEKESVRIKERKNSYLILAVRCIVVLRKHAAYQRLAKASRPPDLVVFPRILKASDVRCFINKKASFCDNGPKTTFSVRELDSQIRHQRVRNSGRND